MPSRYPVFSKPIINLKGMGQGSRVMRNASDFEHYSEPGHFWMQLLSGEHVSTDCALENGRAVWWRHANGKPFGDGMFDYWTIHAARRPALEQFLSQWIARSLAGYTGMVNFETIGNVIIEAHLRFADQWCDLYGKGWVEALVGLYRDGEWHFDDRDRRDGYSLALFARHGQRYRHPARYQQSAIRALPGVESLQISFHENKPPEEHSMPPGGFRVGLINSYDLRLGQAARGRLADCFPSSAILWPEIPAELMWA